MTQKYIKLLTFCSFFRLRVFLLMRGNCMVSLTTVRVTGWPIIGARCLKFSLPWLLIMYRLLLATFQVTESITKHIISMGDRSVIGIEKSSEFIGIQGLIVEFQFVEHSSFITPDACISRGDSQGLVVGLQCLIVTLHLIKHIALIAQNRRLVGGDSQDLLVGGQDFIIALQFVELVAFGKPYTCVIGSDCQGTVVGF